jgi:adenylate cyclase
MQLKLFAGNTPKTHHLQLRKKSAKTLKPTSPHWDLWTQESNQEKEMALLFLDIRNFTPLTEAQQAFDVVHLIKKLFSVFQGIIRNHHGRIVETSGDGFYAVFGLNQNIQEAVNDAVRAGTAILKNLESLNATSFEKNLGRRVEAGIGLHAGKVAMGNIHLSGEDHLMVMGYSVNVAARLQSATKELNNNFIISSTVFDLLTSPPKGVAMNVNLRGVKDMFQLYLIGEEYTPAITPF